MTPFPQIRDLVLIGGGHAHALVVRRWAMDPLPGTRLTLINPDPVAPYTGMLPGLIAGHYRREELMIDLVRLARFAGARLILDRATGIDRDARLIHLSGRAPLPYDLAAIDVGITSDLPDVPGALDHAVAAKPLGAYAVRWEAFLSRRLAYPRVIILGAGLGGVELALATAHRLRAEGVKAQVTLLDRGGSPLPELSATARRTVLKALEAFGAEIEITHGYVKVKAPGGRLPGGTVRFPVVSVGATENALMAGVLAKGTCVIENAAREPEIVDLCNCLIAMGAHIDGVGTDTLTIEGRDRLHGATYAVMPDRIEAGSYACAAAITGGSVELIGADLGEMGATFDALREAGVTVTVNKGIVTVASNGHLGPLTLSTAPYPGFATDMQAQFMAMLCKADGASMLTETIFENRYMHVPELARMGADITVKGRSAMVRGVKTLTGAPVMATDLRASMSLIIAGLAAEGETQVQRVYHLDRGYERLEEKLAAVGADIERDSDG